MKKKGFTLIELLAVIVILAIVALIATPTILGVIQKSKKASSEASAYGYIDAVEKYIMTNSMNMSKPNINNGIYKDSELEVSYKGKGPDNALITIEKGIVKEAKLCINKYSFDYDGKEVTNSINNYCSNNYKVKLVIDDNIEEKSIEKETNTTFEVSDITNKTNIVCNNGAIPILENNILTISNIFGDTTCKINSTLESTINNIDNTENNIIMIGDEEISDGLVIASKTINLNLNGYIIDESEGTTTYAFKNLGSTYFKYYDSSSNETGTIKGKSFAIWSGQNTKIIIENGNYFSTEHAAVASSANNSTTIYNGTFIGRCAFIQNSTNNSYIYGGYFKNIEGSNWNVIGLEVSSGTLTISGNVIIEANNNGAISSKTGASGDLIIENGVEIYGSACSIVWYSTGKLNIDNIIFNNSGSAGILNYSVGSVNIKSGSFTTDNNSLFWNVGEGTFNILNGTFKSNYSIFYNPDKGTYNVCGGTLYAGTYDLNNTSTGTINYSSDVIFTNGTNAPNVYNSSGTINANYTGTCISN